MNMPPPAARKKIENISSKLGEAVVAKASMIQVAVEIKEKEGKVISVFRLMEPGSDGDIAH